LRDGVVKPAALAAGSDHHSEGGRCAPVRHSHHLPESSHVCSVGDDAFPRCGRLRRHAPWIMCAVVDSTGT
jgi:hypothetical protein